MRHYVSNRLYKVSGLQILPTNSWESEFPPTRIGVRNPSYKQAFVLYFFDVIGEHGWEPLLNSN